MTAQRKPKTEATDLHLKVVVGGPGNAAPTWMDSVLTASDELSTILQNLNAVMTLLSLARTRSEVACDQVYCLLLPIQQGLDRIETQLDIG